VRIQHLHAPQTSYRFSVLSACHPGPTDSGKWKSLRRACRAGTLGIPGAFRKGKQKGYGGQK